MRKRKREREREEYRSTEKKRQKEATPDFIQRSNEPRRKEKRMCRLMKSTYLCKRTTRIAKLEEEDEESTQSSSCAMSIDEAKEKIHPIVDSKGFDFM